MKTITFCQRLPVWSSDAVVLRGSQRDEASGVTALHLVMEGQPQSLGVLQPGFRPTATYSGAAWPLWAHLARGSADG